MPPLPRVVFSFDGAAQDQSRGTRNLPVGAFAELRNTRQLKRGTLQKRRAFHRQAVTLTNLTGETVTNGTAFDSLGWAGGCCYRDSRDNFWSLNGARDTAYYRGNLPRLHPTLRSVGHGNNKTHKAFTLLAGSNLWVFSLGDFGTDFTVLKTTRRIVYSVFDAATGALQAGPIEANTAAATFFHYTAVYDGTRYIWCFTVEGGRFVVASKIDTQAPTALPAQTNYYDGGADFKANCVDAVKIGSSIYVAVTSYNSGAGKLGVARTSLLNAATGLESAGTDALSYSPANQAVSCQIASGPSFLQDQPGGSFGYYGVWAIDNAGGNDGFAQLYLVKFDLATTATSSLTKVRVETPPAVGVTTAGLVSGYYDPSDGSTVMFSQIATVSSSNQDPTSVKIVRRHVTSSGGVTVTSIYARGAILASKPFKDTASSRWYLLTQYDDGETVNLQRSWHVRTADRAGPLCRNIVIQEAWGQAAAAYHMWQSDTPATASIITHGTPWCPGVPLLSGKFYAPIELNDGQFKTSPRVMVLDTAAAYSPPARIAGGLLCYPQGVPQVVGPRDKARDLSPLMGPTDNPACSAGAGTAIADVLITYCYRYVTSDGRITRSPFLPEPFRFIFTDGAGNTMDLQSLRHVGRDGNGAEIEVWATAPGGTDVFFQFAVPNDPTNSVASLAVTPSLWNELGEPQPVGLVASPPPPCRVAAMFRDRLFLAGTDIDGDLWFSQPIEEGGGIELNAEGLRQVIRGGAINAAAAIDWNSFALFRRDGITCIQGNGPSGDGGTYETVEIHHAQGVERTATAGHVVVPTSRGVFFHGTGDSRIQLLTSGLQVVEASQGITDVVLASVVPAPILTAGMEVVNDGATWLQFGDGTTCMLDHRNTTQAAPLGDLGSWHTWTSQALAAADAFSAGLVDDSGTPVWLSSSGVLRRPKTSLDAEQWRDDLGGGLYADVLQKWKTGKVAPSGMHAEVYVSDLQLLGTHVGASDCRLTVINDANVPENHDITTSSPLNYVARPANCIRTQELELSFEERASSTEGPYCDGFAMEFRPNGAKRLATGRIF